MRQVGRVEEREEEESKSARELWRWARTWRKIPTRDSVRLPAATRTE
jgi:hypothetical protein